MIPVANKMRLSLGRWVRTLTGWGGVLSFLKMLESDVRMISFSMASERSARRKLFGRLSEARLPAPVIVSTGLLGCVFLLRLPSALVAREFNLDESQLLSEAMKFLVDPRPWKGVDSCGPLSSYLISIFLLMGFKASYILAHMLATLLVCLQVLVAYRTLRRLGSEKAAALGASLLAFLYGTYTNVQFLHYGTELLPALLLMVGFYLYLVWLDETAVRPAAVRLSLLCLSGLVLGAAPWSKLQALPISGALGLLVLAAIFRDRGPSASSRQRVRELVAFGCGTALTTGILLAVAAEAGALKDSWYSYILAPIAYAGGLSFTTSMEDLVRIFFLTPVNQLLLVALLGIALLDYAFVGSEIKALFQRQRWAFGGLLVYSGAALFTTCRSRYFWPHHTIFFIPPMAYLAATLTSCGLNAFIKTRRSARRSRTSALGLLAPLLSLIAAAALYVAYGVRYIQKIANIHELHSVQSASSAGTTDGAPNRRDPLASLIGPRDWALPDDGKEKMVELVEDIKKTRPVRSLAIWGWEPGVYVLTGIPPATRDTITYHMITTEPLQQYFRDRFLSDLRAYPPDLFIDAVAKGAFLWPAWTENDGYESDPQLQKFIDDNYVLVNELTLVKAAKPVRFFVRRNSEPPHTHP
jgi:hypothetical protein